VYGVTIRALCTLKARTMRLKPAAYSPSCSFEHALAMMADALQALASHQALRRRPTLQLRPAPTEIWDLAADAVPLDLTAHVDRRRRGAASPSAGPWGLYGLVSQKPPASRAR